MDLDYLIGYKQQLTAQPIFALGVEPWDLFVSAYNDSERVRSVFNLVQSKDRHWLGLPEYEYRADELPANVPHFLFPGSNEADFTIGFFESLNQDLTGLRICLDITGFMRPHILFFLRFLVSNGVKALDVLYSEPVMYSQREKTAFSRGDVIEVRQVAGYEGVHSPDMSNDLLLMAAGYDHDLVARVASNKDSAQVVQIYGLPSLSPDMYQESILRLEKAAEAIAGKSQDEPYFCSANDPFVTAAVLRRIVQVAEKRKPVTNYYLSPLATKPQALGFGLFFLREMTNRPASIIFPFARLYSRETSKGLGRIWRYQIDLS